VDILRLDLGTINVVDDPWPVHGFVVLHESLGPVLVDTGCGGPDGLLRQYRVVNRRVADALAAHSLSPADVRLVVNTHLHFDHCGQNPAFPHARMLVQRRERERVQRDEPDIEEWLTTAGVKFELVDGDVELADGLRIVATPGHTSGHQCVIASTPHGSDLFVGDAAMRRSVWDSPTPHNLPPLQAADLDSWQSSLQRLRALTPDRVHFCHDTAT